MNDIHGRVGLRMPGLPKTKKYDKLRHYLTEHERFVKVWKGINPIKVTVFVDEKVSTGEALFIFDNTPSILSIARKRSNGYRLDKSHTLSTSYVQVCKTCYSDISKGDNVSPIDCFSCAECVMHLCCSCRIPISGPPRLNETYQACKSCLGNRRVQEIWRNSIPVYDKKMSVTIPKHLCDEAIEHEKKLHGGEPNEPCIMETPFTSSYSIDYLVDPKSSMFWPYGMTAYEYLKYKHKMRFDNPISETPDDSWMDIEVTEGLLTGYWTKMKDLQEKFNFKSLSDTGTMPTTFDNNGTIYKLFPDIHGFTCDDPKCQAINHHQEGLDGGAYAAFVLTGLPIFTSRMGDLSGPVKDLGYGKEYCLVCITK